MKTCQTLALFSLLSFAFADWQHGQHVLHDNSIPIEKSVAIIGGGAAGTSTAFWLSNVFSHPDKVRMTLFEQSEYIGGRSTTVPIKDDAATWGSIELGASIFVEANKNLMKAVDTFNLTRTKLTEVRDDKRPGLGIWDGKEFLFEQSGTLWDTIVPIWRYGLISPLKFQRKQKAVVDQFMKLYDSDLGFEHVPKAVRSLQFESLLNQSAIDYLKDELGINDAYAYEVLQSATRGNYCQDLNRVHALAVMVSMEAGHGTWALEEGNFKIFEEFASRSGADVRLNTKVTAIYNVTEFDQTGKPVHRYAVQTSDGAHQVFDDVVLASPLALSDIQFGFPAERHHRDYHVVHVTLVSGHINPHYFGKDSIDKTPTFVITTGHPLVKNFQDGSAPFQTFSVHRQLDNGEQVIKIFSSHELGEEELDELFLNKSWTFRKKWHAFPELYPITDEHQFVPFVLKMEGEENGIIYTSAFENFISTMETQTIAAIW
ncbi:hypothetical protein CU097_004773 [Rhizopus azygosporus]|uniref:Prenylcysteine lyase domain-containing protein n=1 Tax=Rhizopus azygosporus TaxID=86630 RepID=A0A367J985_RHIAZ|nr:hypothetical protein CU097_004773 [Rhizopus azygosporus]